MEIKPIMEDEYFDKNINDLIKNYQKYTKDAKRNVKMELAFKKRCIELYNNASTYNQFSMIHICYMNSWIPASFNSFESLNNNVVKMSDTLCDMLDKGFIMFECQIGHKNSNEYKFKYGYGYMTGLLRNDVADKLDMDGSQLLLLKSKSQILSYQNKNMVDLVGTDLGIKINMNGNDLSHMYIHSNLHIMNCINAYHDLFLHMRRFNELLLDFLKSNYQEVTFLDPLVGDHGIINNVDRLLVK